MSTRAHRRRRGSTYVEALVVAALFTFMWIGILTFGRHYRVKLTSLFRAREDAWSATAGACGNPRDGLNRALEDLARAPDAARAQAVLDAAARLQTQGGPSTSALKAHGLTPFAAADRELSVETTTRFACNEAPVSATRDLTTRRWLENLLRGAGR